MIGLCCTPTTAIGYATPLRYAFPGIESSRCASSLAHVTQMQALDLIPGISRTFEDAFGRASGGLVRPYRTEDADDGLEPGRFGPSQR